MTTNKRFWIPLKHQVRRWSMVLGVLVLCVTSVYPKQRTISNEIVLNPFKSVCAVGNKHTTIILKQDMQYKINVDGCSATDIKVNTADGNLLISTFSLDTTHSVQIQITAPMFEDINRSYADLMTKDLFCSNLEITAISTNLDMNLHADSFKLKFLDGNHARLEGECKTVTFKCQGFDEGKRYTFDASKLATQSVRAKCGVLSDIFLNVSDSLWLEDGTDCKISIIGSPVIPENNLKWSEIHMQNK